MKRRGGILTESIVAMLLMSIVTVATGEVLSLMKRQSRILSQRATAIQECQIALASAAEIPAVGWNAETLSAFSLPSQAAAILPEGSLAMIQEPGGKDQEGTRLRARVRWRPAPSADLASVELSLWRFDLPQGDSKERGGP